DDRDVDHPLPDGLCDRGANGECGQKIEHSCPYNGCNRTQNSRSNNGCDRVRRVVEAVDEIEHERDDDDPYYVVNHGRLTVLERDRLEDICYVLTLVQRILQRVVQLLPLDDVERVRRTEEERAYGLMVDRIAFFLEELELSAACANNLGILHACHC